MGKSRFGKSALDFLKKGLSKVQEKAAKGLEKALEDLNKKVGKAAKNERDRFRTLAVVSPGRGDVLICKEWGFKDEDGDWDEDRMAPLIAQAFFKKRGGTRFSEHLALSVGKEGGVTHICHSNGAGVNKDTLPDRDMVVYRCTIEPLRLEAAHIALVLAGEEDTDYGAKVKAGDYAASKAAKSLTKSKGFRRGAKRYMDELFNLVYGKENPTGDPTKRPQAPPMFCSEFVAACYALANEWDLGVSSLRVDPRAMTPKGLEALLARSSGIFVKAGRVSGTAAPYV